MEVKDYFSLLETVLSRSSKKLNSIRSEDFDKIIEHIQNLICSSMCLIRSDFYTQAMFLGITALEEAVKLEMCTLRGSSQPLSVGGKDPLLSHFSKHRLSVIPEILLIGDRPQKDIGRDKLITILNKLQNGQIKISREECLYFESVASGTRTPKDMVHMNDALEFMLVCIEIIDDKFCGLSMKSNLLSESLDDFYNELLDKYLSLNIVK